MAQARRSKWLIAAALALPSLAWASDASEMFTHTTLLLIAMITLADWCGFLFERVGLPRFAPSTDEQA
jgi:hypothetical protein